MLRHIEKLEIISILVLQRLVQHQPTQHPTSEELSIGNIKFKAFDLGGHQIARRVWKDYYAKVNISLITLQNIKTCFVFFFFFSSEIPISDNLFADKMVEIVAYVGTWHNLE